jgi:DNA-binding beta-propeller fold protein YncE
MLGNSPQGIGVDARTGAVYVANQFDDTISVLGS